MSVAGWLTVYDQAITDEIAAIALIVGAVVYILVQACGEGIVAFVRRILPAPGGQDRGAATPTDSLPGVAAESFAPVWDWPIKNAGLAKESSPADQTQRSA